MQSKRNFILFFFILSAVAVLFPLCRYGQYDKASYHSFVKTDEFKKMVRSDQIAKCGTCHKQEYENELKGPHANAYKMLMEHTSFVNSNAYQCSFWTRHVNTHADDCMACHTPQNLFQTLLYDTLHNQDKLIKDLLERSPLPLKREDAKTRLTGIDCFSCHFDGNQMISLKHTKTANDSNPAYQTVEMIAKNNLTCYPCHTDEIKTISARMAINRTGSVQCTNCHEETSKTGADTHYFYWRHDLKDKVSPTLVSVMDDLHFKLLPDHKTGEITWLNTTIPHVMSPIIEIILKCDVMDKDSNLLGSKTIRINRKYDFDTLMYERLGNNTLYGVQGDSASLNGTGVKYNFLIKKPATADIFKVSLFQKAQYWFPDSLGVITATKVYPVK